jgi:hypothetical protein
VAIHKKPTTWIATGYRPRNDGHAAYHQQVGSEQSRTERSNPEKISAHSWIASRLAMTDTRLVIGRHEAIRKKSGKTIVKLTIPKKTIQCICD